MIVLKKFFTNWRAQRGKFLNIPLIFHTFSYAILNKLARAARKIFKYTICWGLTIWIPKSSLIEEHRRRTSVAKADL